MMLIIAIAVGIGVFGVWAAWFVAQPLETKPRCGRCARPCTTPWCEQCGAWQDPPSVPPR